MPDIGPGHFFTISQIYRALPKCTWIGYLISFKMKIAISNSLKEFPFCGFSLKKNTKNLSFKSLTPFLYRVLRWKHRIGFFQRKCKFMQTQRFEIALLFS